VVPSVVFVEEVVGLMDVLQQIPLVVTSNPPLSVIFPPPVAVVDPMAETAFVVSTGSLETVTVTAVRIKLGQLPELE
jgi:hypothetical protein